MICIKNDVHCITMDDKSFMRSKDWFLWEILINLFPFDTLLYLFIIFYSNGHSTRWYKIKNDNDIYLSQNILRSHLHFNMGWINKKLGKDFKTNWYEIYARSLTQKMNRLECPLIINMIIMLFFRFLLMIFVSICIKGI